MPLLRLLTDRFRGENLQARALRGSSMTILRIGGENGLRLISNLILTRLLFPEAFGIMALVQIFVIGLQTFSDIGIKSSIIQSDRGDDPTFLNTAWTMQVLRGGLLWLGACALAWPAAQIYDEPLLASLLPIVGLVVFIDGFRTTNEPLANRHLHLGRLVTILLSTQALGVVIYVGLALWLQSIWALALGNILLALLRLTALNWLLPGARNRFQWDHSSFQEIFHFGKYIFLATIARFVVTTSDRAILGANIDTALLGVFSIGLMMGTLPNLFTRALAQSILFPLYRLAPPTKSRANQRKLFRMRRVVSLVAILTLALLAMLGGWLIETLYDPRYILAGPMVVLFALRSVPESAFIGTQHVLLANGDSRNFLILTGSIAVIQVALLSAGIALFGIPGAILAPTLALLITYPLRIILTHRYGAWDPIGELGALALGFALTGVGCWLHWDAIGQLLP
ncbi:oligosaccharide flippase family protein [Aestuariibius sp. HNIBRBA575]|uniref:oligosaccharide flippase family protein n=1 Tax=Aestuariibius sp. HNIBRBA575 TaxID=3233343 RepID=UPI0034A50ABD